uniref:Ig-like domain-containing protein n=1 Tax=Echeneis naucrates TaxID=173247 RepID=A0A665VKC9_ECHNA
RFCLISVIGWFNTGPACALEITSQIKYYYVAGDSSVTLQCEFVLASDNLAHTEIEWIIVPPDRDKDEDVIIWYTGGIIYDNLLYMPQDGIASITMTDLKHTDSGTYQCKVKKLSDIASKNLFLSVMERPSEPADLRLRCRSSQGTPPLVYKWAKRSGLPLHAFVDTIMGDLYLKKISERDCGMYLCEVENLLGKEECEVVLSFTSLPTKDYGPDTIAAAVVSVVVVIVIVITTVICYHCRKKTQEEFGNRILEEAPPPYPRPSRKRPSSHSQGSVQVRKLLVEYFSRFVHALQLYIKSCRVCVRNPTKADAINPS